MQEIKLTKQETEWISILNSFEISLDESYKIRISKLETAGLLSKSLLEREVIPEIRLKYFVEPAYNLGNTKRSHKDNFNMNGTVGEEILSHPSFFKYLKYFIYGADLPEELKVKLGNLYKNMHYDDDFVEAATPILKQYFFNSSVERSSFSEEVFKMSLDLGVQLNFAKIIRDKVLKWKR